MKEKIRIFVCNKCCNTAYTTDVSIPGACTSQYWVRTSGICGGHYSEIEGAERAVLSMTTPHFDWVVNQEVEKRIKERMPSEEEMLQMVAGHIPWLIASARNSKKYVNPFTSGHAFSEVIRILSENLSRELRSRMSEPNKEGR
jgi:hypothetical protein